jgi:hypothetical protein
MQQKLIRFIRALIYIVVVTGESNSRSKLYINVKNLITNA